MNLLLLAKAAEKYEVYPAMDMQYTYAVSELYSPMTEASPSTQIIAYAVKQDILLVAAPLMLHKPLDEIQTRTCL